MSNVAIIIINWNGKDLTLACLSSLARLQITGIKLTIIVVDNNSSDSSVDAIKKKFPHVALIQNKQNLGFTGGNNIGIKYATTEGAEFIWLLNNDTTVDQKALSGLLAAFSHDSVGVVGSKIYFAAGYEFHKDRYNKSERGNVLWYAGGIIDWQNMYASHRGVDEVDKGQYDTIEETQFVTGCSMMIRRKVLDAIGPLDERYYLYLEDLDFCLRAKRAGFLLLYAPGSNIWHKNAGSSARPGNKLHEYYFTRNRLLVGKKFAPFRTKVALLREAARFLIQGSEIKRKAVLDALFCRFGNNYLWRKNI